MNKQNGNNFVYDESKSFEVNVIEQIGGLSKEDLFFVKEYADTYEKIITGDKRNKFAKFVAKIYRTLYIDNKKGDALKKALSTQLNNVNFFTKTANFNCLVSGLYRYNLLHKKAFSKVKELSIPQCNTDALSKLGNVLFEYYTNGTDVYEYIEAEYKKGNAKVLTKFFTDFEASQKLDKENALLLLTFLTDKYGVLMFDEHKDVKTKFKVNNPNKNKGKKDSDDSNKNEETTNGKDETKFEPTSEDIEAAGREMLEYIGVTLEEAKGLKDVMNPYMEKIAILEDKLKTGDILATKKMIEVLDECKEAIQKSKEKTPSNKSRSIFDALMDKWGDSTIPKPKEDNNISVGSSTKDSDDSEKFVPKNYDVETLLDCAESTEDTKTLNDLINKSKLNNISEILTVLISDNTISKDTKVKLKAMRFEKLITVKNLHDLLSGVDPDEYDSYLNMHINIKPQLELYNKLKSFKGGKEEVMNRLKKMLETLK